jgi:hypothetical protein
MASTIESQARRNVPLASKVRNISEMEFSHILEDV